MSKVDLKFAELHSPLFMGGTPGVNLGLKLDPRHRAGLKLVYDREEKELWVSFGGTDVIVPVGNVASMTPGLPEGRGKEAVESATPAPRPTAQVSTPQSHVFAGEGHGKKGK